MRNGAVAFKQTVLTAHPVETIQKTVRIQKNFSNTSTLFFIIIQLNNKIPECFDYILFYK